MKKLLLFTSFCFLGSVLSFSQSLTVWMNDTVVTGPVSGDLECIDSLYNTTASTLDVDVVRTMDVNTGTWQSAFCLDVCYLPAKDSVRFTLNPNEHQGMIVHFYTDATPATGDCWFKFKNVNTPSNKFYQGFHATSQLGFGVHETNNPAASVGIYPMPVIAGNDFTVRVSNVKNTTEELSLIVFDMLGNEVYKTRAYQGINFMNFDLTSGVYSYSLISANQKLASGKIAVSK